MGPLEQLIDKLNQNKLAIREEVTAIIKAKSD